MIGPPLRRLDLADQTGVEKSSGVHDDVYTAELGHGLFEDGLDIFFFGDVARGDEDVAFELGGYAFEFLCVAADEDDAFGADFGPGFGDSLGGMLVCM